MPHREGSNIKLLPVYGVDHYGTDVFLPIRDTLATTSLTISGTTITKSTQGGNVPIDEQDEIASDIDTINFYNEGNDTEFNQTYRWTPDMSAIVYKTRVQIAFALNVSSISAGSFDLTNVAIRFQEQPVPKVLYENDFAVTMGALSTVSDAFFILDADVVEPFKVFSGNPIDIRIQTTVTTGTGTFQVGVLPLFCYTTPAVMKPFTSSGITFHIHASLDHADPVFNEDIGRIV